MICHQEFNNYQTNFGQAGSCQLYLQEITELIYTHGDDRYVCVCVGIIDLTQVIPCLSTSTHVHAISFTLK